MTWDDDVPSRPTLSRHYAPPHLTHTNIKATTPPSPLRQPSTNSSYRSRPRRRGSRYFSSRDYSFVHQKPFEIAERLDELEVLEDDTNHNTTSVANSEDIPVQSTGSNIPAPVNTFADIHLGSLLNYNIKRCKYVKPTPIQKHAIPIAVAGRDLMACAQTGSGKTAAFCFPIISGILRTPSRTVGSARPGHTRIAYPSALILAPTRELSCQIHEEARKFAYKTGVKIVVVYGGAPIVRQFCSLEKGVDILVATPGRLLDMIEGGRVSLTMIKYLALDEADRMLDMGFEPQIRKIVQQMGMPPSGERQTMLFSATFPHEIQELASDFLSNYIFLAVGRVGSSTDLIEQKVELVQDIDKRNHLMELLRAQKSNGAFGKHSLTLIFVETKRGADALEHWLSMNGFPATAIHGDKVQMERERALKSFKSGTTPILVATDVASRGLDIPHVSHVINFDLPSNIDNYVHRIGRTGRAGKSGVATAFFSDKNMAIAKALVELMNEANQEVPSWLSQYSESSSYGDAGRAKRYGGGSKFAGYDFRSDSQFGTKNYYHPSAHDSVDSLVHSYASPSALGYAVPSADYYGAGSNVASYGYGFDHESSDGGSGWK